MLGNIKEEKMRIKENVYHDNKLYSSELQERVVEVFHYTSYITEIKRLIGEIREESLNLGELFWTEEELKKRKEVLSFFNARMEATVYYTLKNIEGYKEIGWKKIIYEGENSDEGVNSIKKED